ncbi:o-methyltransferase [Colletotrichum kahawae]|uniref:O-methyltransferase n=1 Tax=Colletotrichum kahawae TaxID=34407 RepID=A0AAE0D375_COLKA|nr:o-methyltransferase [Colletotrichum kahawae]
MGTSDHELTVDSFVRSIENVNSSSFSNESDRMKALLAAQALLARLESPWDTVPALGAAIRTVKDLELFERWNEHGNGPLTSAQAAEIIGNKCDPALLYRLLRLLAANHLLEEVSLGTFKPTQFGVATTAPVFNSLFSSYYSLILPIYAKLPKFFEATGQSGFQYAHGWDGDLWSYYQAHPKEEEEFSIIQQSIAAQQPAWIDIYPADSLLDTNPDTSLLVDIGGSTGHDILKFHGLYPDKASRLYLEDLGSVVEKAELPSGVNKVAYDFFTPQPVQCMSRYCFVKSAQTDQLLGARAYLMHSILHDWSDEPARKILEMQKDAMTPGYSRLLIQDHIDVEGPANPQATAFDIQMMAMVSGRERSEKDWRQLLTSAGFNVVKIWKLPSAAHSIIEAEIPV